jgi:hypothetical protein
VILFLRDPKNCTNKILVEVINSFGKVAGYKVNIQQLFYIKKGTDQERHQRKNPTYHRLTNNTVPRNKFNKRNQRPI